MKVVMNSFRFVRVSVGDPEIRATLCTLMVWLHRRRIAIGRNKVGTSEVGNAKAEW